MVLGSESSVVLRGDRLLLRKAPLLTQSTGLRHRRRAGCSTSGGGFSCTILLHLDDLFLQLLDSILRLSQLFTLLTICEVQFIHFNLFLTHHAGDDALNHGVARLANRVQLKEFGKATTAAVVGSRTRFATALRPDPSSFLVSILVLRCS